MTSLSKKTTDSMSADSASLGRLPFVAAATVIAIAAASLWALEGRASSRKSVVNIVASTSIVNVCPGDASRARVRLRAEGVPPTCAARYKWEATGGRIVGEGPDVVWDFTGTRVDFSSERLDKTPSKNFYDVKLTVEGGAACDVRRAVSVPTRVVVWDCPPRVNSLGNYMAPATPAPRCPSISLCCHSTEHGQLMPFSATLSGGDPGVRPTFKWTLYGGEVASGLGTDSIMVDGRSYAGRTILATLEVGGYGPRCSASCATEAPLPTPPPYVPPTPTPTPTPRYPTPTPTPPHYPTPTPTPPYDPTPTPTPSPSPSPSPTPTPSPTPSPSPTPLPCEQCKGQGGNSLWAGLTGLGLWWLLLLLIIVALCMASYSMGKRKHQRPPQKPPQPQPQPQPQRQKPSTY